MRKIISISIILIFFTLHYIPSSALGNGNSITLIYSSNTLGGVEPGCCPETGNAGGLARRAYYIKKVREEAKNLLVLDAGDALVLGYFDRTSEREKAQKRAEFVLKVYEKMGYDAINIGDTDIGLGLKYLQALQKRSKIPFLSANLKDKKTGRSIFKPFLIKEKDGLRIGIIGLLTSDILTSFHKEMKGYFIEDPIKVANETINRLMPNCDFIIGLAHLKASDIDSLAKRVPQISIIIGGNDRNFVFPKKIHRALYVQTDAYGIHIGRLDLAMVSGASEFVDVLPKILFRRNIDEIRKKMKDLQFEKEMKSLKNLQEILIEQEKKLPETEGKNTYANFLTLLHPRMDSDKEIEKLIDSSRDQLKRPLP